jgi:beta-galactosidase GanA
MFLSKTEITKNIQSKMLSYIRKRNETWMKWENNWVKKKNDPPAFALKKSFSYTQSLNKTVSV